MRLWHKDLLPYLPDLQFKGQLRELVLIMHDWRDRGKTNHLLINKVMSYGKEQLHEYFLLYAKEWNKRYIKDIDQKIYKEFEDFCGLPKTTRLFLGWHDKEYLRVCMANLYEKYHFGVGKSAITPNEFRTLRLGYYKITGEAYTV